MSDFEEVDEIPIATSSNKYSSKRVKTSANFKQHFEYLFAMHLSHKGLPDNFSFIRMFVVSAMGNKEIRDKVIKELDNLEEFGINKEEVLKSINYFKDIYIKTGSLRGLRELFISSDISSERVRQVIDQKLMEINKMLPAIQDYLLILFVAIIKDTDAEFQKAPREIILHPDKYEFGRKIEQKSYFQGGAQSL